MLTDVQRELKPSLIPVNQRHQVARGFSSLPLPFEAGTALALMAPPGVDLHHLVREFVREIQGKTKVVWVDLANIQEVVATYYSTGDPTEPGGAWDQAIEAMFRASFDEFRQRSSETAAGEAAPPPADGTSGAANAAAREPAPGSPPSPSGDAAVGLSGASPPLVQAITSFALEARAQGEWPYIVLEAMHCLPSTVSHRLQPYLRKALDEPEYARHLRLILTGHSSFLSYVAIPSTDFQLTSPLYERTTCYLIPPYQLRDLWALIPLPHFLPDRLLEVLHGVTGGSVGLLEIFMDVLHKDPSFGQMLLAAWPEGTKGMPPALGEMLARCEGIAQPARALVKEGFDRLLTSYSAPLTRESLKNLEELSRSRPVSGRNFEDLLYLELTGFATLISGEPAFECRVVSPLVPTLMEAVLPRADTFRHRLEQELASLKPVPNQPKSEIESPKALRNVRTTLRTTGAQTHVTPNLLETLREVARRAEGSTIPLTMPPDIKPFVNDTGPASARALVVLLMKIASAVRSARDARQEPILTLSQLEIKWRELPESGFKDDSITLEVGTKRRHGNWEVAFKPHPEGDRQRLEILSLFAPPDRLNELLSDQAEGKPFVAKEGDDAYTFGILAGLLLTRETGPNTMLTRLEDRFTDATDLGVGPMIRLIKACLSPKVSKRPSLQAIETTLGKVLTDRYRGVRKALRVVFYAFLVMLLVVGVFDFIRDTQVDNLSTPYTMLKLAGTIVPALAYGLLYFFGGKEDRSQVNKDIRRFIAQRLNRLKWLILANFLALAGIAVFGQHLLLTQGVRIRVPSGAQLDSVLYRLEGEDLCHTVHAYSPPRESGFLRLRTDARAYSFIVREKEGEREFFWPMDGVQAQRQHGWGDTLTLDALKEPPDGVECLLRKGVQQGP